MLARKLRRGADHTIILALFQQQAEQGAPAGSVLIAGSQTAGRGRLGRTFFSPADTGLYLSLLLRPKFSIMNPALTQTLPAYQTASGIADIMAHLFERYFTTSKDVEVTDRLIEGLLLSVIHEAPRVVENPDDYGARANIMWAGMMAHNNICGVGRNQDWASHSIEHELSALYDCAHGAGLAVIFPAWMEYNMHRDVMRFAQLANRVWGCSMDFEHPERTAKAGIEALRTFLRSIGMPLTLTELGAREEDIPYLAHTACYGNGKPGFLGKFAKLYEEDVAAIYRLAL